MSSISDSDEIDIFLGPQNMAIGRRTCEYLWRLDNVMFVLLVEYDRLFSEGQKLS